MDLIMMETPPGPEPAAVPPPPAVVYAEADLSEVVLLPFAGSQVAAFSTRAPGKATVNEDALALIPAGPRSGVLVVADGLGGPPSGELASRLAVQILTETVRDAAIRGRPLREAILSGIDLANASILARGTGAATTLAAVEIHEGLIRSYHVGDAMILVVGQKGKIKLQSIAHSPVGYAVEAGLLDVDEAVHHKGRNLVSNVLGSPDMRIEMGPPLRLAPRDTLLLASDGLADNLYLDEIVEGIRKGPLARATAGLVARCARRMTGVMARQPGQDSHDRGSFPEGEGGSPPGVGASSQGASSQGASPQGASPQGASPQGASSQSASSQSASFQRASSHEARELPDGSALPPGASSAASHGPTEPTGRPNNPDDLTLVAFRLPPPTTLALHGTRQRGQADAQRLSPDSELTASS